MFYEEIHEKRKQLGLSIEQVSQKIKINQEILEKIEKGEFSTLPDLYIRLFIKSYSAELGLNPEEYLQKYEEEYGSKKHDVKQAIQQPKSESVSEPVPVSSFSDRNKLLIFISTVAVLIFVIVILKQVLSENEAPTISPVHQKLIQQDTTEEITSTQKEEVKTPAVTKKQPVQEEQPAIVKDDEPIETTSAAVDSSTLFDLKMEINDTCWVKIVIDEKDTSEAIFRPGTVREWQAFKVFDLRVGRPEVVNLYINGVEVDSIDTSKAPSRMMITEQGIINR